MLIWLYISRLHVQVEHIFDMYQIVIAHFTYKRAVFYEGIYKYHTRQLQLCGSLMMASMRPKHVEDYNSI
jgi:hypothetical protein